MRLKIYRGIWCAVWNENGDTRRKSLHTTDRGIAERALATLRAEPGVGTLHTVRGIYQAYLADKGTVRASWAWGQLEHTFGNLRPDHVTRTICRGYITKRRTKVTDGTIHTELTYLRAALRWHNPHTPAVVELPSKPAPSEKYLQRPDYVRLLNSAGSPHIRLFLLLALTTAGRMTAILELTWDRIDFEHEIIRLGTGEKRRKGRANVPMTAAAKAALLAAYQSRSCDHVIEFGGQPVQKIRKAFATAAAAAKVPWCTPHVLRHTAAVWMAEGGIPMAEIAQYLGHSDSRITERVYARFSPTHLRRAGAVLEGSFAPPTPVRSAVQVLDTTGRSERI